MLWTVVAGKDMRFFFNSATRRRAPSSGYFSEIARTRSADLGGIFEIDFLGVCFEAILIKGPTNRDRPAIGNFTGVACAERPYDCIFDE